MPVSPSVDAYLAALPADKRATLEKIRKAIKAAVPGAEEGISYGVPTFKLHGRMLGSYGAAAKHCALYGFVGADRALLNGYDTSPGTIRFPVGKPLPATLVKKLVRGQIARVEAALVKKTGAKAAKNVAKKSPAVKKKSAAKRNPSKAFAKKPAAKKPSAKRVD